MMDIKDLLVEIKAELEAKDKEIARITDEIETWRERALKAESVKTLDVSGMEQEIARLKSEIADMKARVDRFRVEIDTTRSGAYRSSRRMRDEGNDDYMLQVAFGDGVRCIQDKMLEFFPPEPAPASGDKVCHFDGQTYVCLDSCLLGAHEYSTCKFGAQWQEPAVHGCKCTRDVCASIGKKQYCGQVRGVCTKGISWDTCRFKSDVAIPRAKEPEPADTVADYEFKNNIPAIEMKHPGVSASIEDGILKLQSEQACRMNESLKAEIIDIVQDMINKHEDLVHCEWVCECGLRNNRELKSCVSCGTIREAVR